jgi:hypothetical protein
MRPLDGKVILYIENPNRASTIFLQLYPLKGFRMRKICNSMYSSLSEYNEQRIKMPLVVVYPF